jgi:hypothetical protein
MKFARMNYSQVDKRSIKYFLKRLNGLLESDNLQIIVFDTILQLFAK